MKLGKIVMQGVRSFKISFYQIVTLLILICVLGCSLGAKTLGNSALRSRVLSNIAETRAGIRSSSYKVLTAKENQFLAGYNIHDWSMVDLHEGDVIYGSLPGQFNYYTNIDSAFASEGDSAALGRSLQVEPHPTRGYRPNIGEYVVTKDIRVPGGVIRANPALGPGGMQQYVVLTIQLVSNISSNFS